MELFTHVQELGSMLKLGVGIVIVIAIIAPLLWISGVRAFIGHVFKDILVDHVLKTVWGKRIGTIIVCALALGVATWTGLWLFQGVSETAQVIAAEHAKDTRQAQYAELYERIVEAGLAKSTAAQTGEDQESGTLERIKFWKKDATTQRATTFSVSYNATTGNEITAEATIDNRSNMPGVLVTMHDVDNPKQLYSNKPMVFHIGQQADGYGSTTWVLERDTLTRRGFDNDEAYAFTANKAVEVLTLRSCAVTE